MPEPHRPRSRAHADRQPDISGFDVWLPALVAIATALFLVFGAQAQDVPTDAPRAIYDESLFDEAAIARERAVQALDLAPVTVAPLPPIGPAVPDGAAPASTARTVPFALPAPEPTILEIGLSRFAVAGFIALLLIGALVTLKRTWRRTAAGTA